MLPIQKLKKETLIARCGNFIAQKGKFENHTANGEMELDREKAGMDEWMLAFKITALMRHPDFSDREQPLRPSIFPGFFSPPKKITGTLINHETRIDPGLMG